MKIVDTNDIWWIIKVLEMLMAICGVAAIFLLVSGLFHWVSAI